MPSIRGEFFYFDIFWQSMSWMNPAGDQVNIYTISYEIIYNICEKMGNILVDEDAMFHVGK